MPSRSSQFQKYCNLIVQSKRVCFQLLSAKLCTFSLNICLRKQTTPPDRTDQFVSILVHYIPFTISDVTFTICVAFVSWISLHEIMLHLLVAGQALGVRAPAGHPAQDRRRPIPAHSTNLSSGPHTHGEL